jgi:glycerol uptake facilitator-like aquaporin
MPRIIQHVDADLPYSTGVFFYVYPGIAATASFTLNEANPAFGSLLQVGLAFGFGIAFAIITCGSTSGG